MTGTGGSAMLAGMTAAVGPRAVLPPAPARLRLSPAFITGFLVLFLANLFIGNASTAVWDQDEAAYGGFAHSMAVEGHWLVPRFPYTQAHRKPPLAFWLAAVSCAVLGENDFALRLPSALAIIATIALVAWGSGFLLGRRTAKLAALVLGSTVFVLTLGKLALTDAVLLFFTTVAALALLRGALRRAWWATLLLWVAVAGALLTKGPPIVLVVGGMFVFLLALWPRRRNLVHLHPWFGLPLALVPLALWGYYAGQEDLRYVLFLADFYLMRRVGGITLGQWGPPGTYFLLMFVCLVPWTAYFLPGLRDLWRGLRRRRLGYTLVGAWLVGAWLIWELPLSKLPTYTLGAFPPLALLIARQIERHTAGVLTWAHSPGLRLGQWVTAVLLSLVALGVAVVSLGLAPQWRSYLALAAAALLLSTAWGAWRAARRGAAVSVFQRLLFGTLGAALLIWLIVIPGFESLRAVTRQVAETAAAHCRAGGTVAVAAPVTLPSLPLYVVRAGLVFNDVTTSTEPRATLSVDWSLLRRLRVAEFKKQVQAQNPPRLSPEDDAALRRTRVRELLATGGACAYVLNEEQYAALRDDFGLAPVARISGWAGDRLGSVTYVVVLP